MTADLYDLFVALDLETQSIEPDPGPASRPKVPTPESTPKDQHVQGRSRRRMNRYKPKRHQDISSDSDESSDSDHDEEVANRTLKAEISLVEQSLDERVKRFGNDLDESVKMIQEGLEALSTEGSEDEVDNWHMLSFALQDWK